MSQSKYAFTLNSGLYLKDPSSTPLGETILQKGVPLFLELGFEGLTAKKLATEAHTTEATVYKYFKNKHRLLQYYFQLYWVWLEQQIKVFTAIIDNPQEKLLKAIGIVCQIPTVAADPGVVSKEDLRALVVAEGSKAYQSTHVDADNAQKLFAPYQSLVNQLAQLITKVQPQHPYPLALATTIVEMSHSLEFYKQHLPALTDFAEQKDNQSLKDFLTTLITNSLNIK
jgi:AcrR family transcriptional regulator